MAWRDGSALEMLEAATAMDMRENFSRIFVLEGAPDKGRLRVMPAKDALALFEEWWKATKK